MTSAQHSDPLHVLVTGATGQQGGTVARRLLERGHRVRGLTRDPAAAKARAVAEAGAEVVAGDLTDPDAVDRALAGVDVVFLVTTPFESSPAEETRQGVTVAERAAKAGVRVVYTSVANADTGTGIPHFDSKAAVERRLAELGGAYTIIAPALFLENFLSPMMGGRLPQGRLAMPLAADRPLQVIALDDIAAAAVAVIEQPEKWNGRRIDLASDELTGPQLAAALAAAIGRPVEYQPLPVSVLGGPGEDARVMFEWFDRVGYSADLERLPAELPEVDWHPAAEWASTRDWTSVVGG